MFPLRTLRVAMFAFLPACCAALAAQADTTCTWTGGPTGNWSNSTSWSRGIVPNNGGGFFYSAVVDGTSASPSDVTLNMAATIQTLSITAGDSVSISNAQALILKGGFLTNGGVLTINSSGGTTDLRLDANTDFDGGGEVVGSNTLSNRLYGLNNAVVLTNKLAHTIRGSMQLGVNNLVLSNAGVIQADTPAGLSLDLTDAPTHLNIGTIRATNGSTLSVNSGTFQNTDGSTHGVFEADAGSLLTFNNNVTVQGGILRDVDGNGPGAVRNLQTLTLVDVTLDGPLDLPNGTGTFLQGNMALNGSIELRSSGGTTDLVFKSTPFNFAGSVATLNASNVGSNRLYGTSNLHRLVVPASGYIHGGLQLGINQMLLTNNGLIEADSSAGITVDPTDSGTTQYNTGILRATNGSTLRMEQATYDNTGGLIEAAPGSTVTLNNLTIIGGALRDADGNGSGVVRNISSIQLKSVTLDGPFNTNNGTTTQLFDAIAFDGPFNLSSSGGTTDAILMTSPFVLDGTDATFNASNVIANRLYGTNSAVRLVVPSNATIHGGLQLGINQMLLTNHGLIEADTSAGMVVDLTDGGTTQFNDGTLRATNGSTLTIAATKLDNTGGLIEAAAGSTVVTQDLTVIGGTLRDADGAGSGIIRCQGTTNLDGVTIEGTLATTNGTATYLKSSIDIRGTLLASSTGGTTDLIVATSGFTLGGTGQTQFTNVSANRLYTCCGAQSISIGAGHTVRGSVQMCVNVCSLINQGTIIADATGGMGIDPEDSGQFRNDGTLHLTGGNVTISTGPFQNTGTVQVDAGRTLTRQGAYLQTSGLTRVDGTLTATGGVSLTGGTLGGSGVVGSPVNVSVGTVAPGSSPGVLTLAQGYTQSAFGTLSVDIAGNDPGAGYDQLSVIGNVNLSGALEVKRTPGFVPAPGQAFVVLRWTGSRTGLFTNVSGCEPFAVSYNPDNVTIQFIGTPGGVGDLNADGSVDGTDLGLLLGSWGVCANPCCAADLNGDGLVDGTDLGLLLGEWG